MLLNLLQKEGELTREYSMVGMESYEVYPGHPAYSFIWHICLSIDAMTIAVCVNGDMPIPKDGYLSLACRAHDLTVRLPAYGMVERAKKQPGGEPPWIQVSFVWRKEPGKNDGWATDIRRWMWLTVAAGFVELFERHRARAGRHHNDLAQLGRVIRDSCAHGLNICSRKSGGVRLDNIEILRDDHGKPLSNFFGLGDFFVLALRMFSEPECSARLRGT